MELLSGKQIKQRYDSKPASRIQKIQNLHIALTFLEKEMDIKARNLGIGAEGNLLLFIYNKKFEFNFKKILLMIT